MEDKFPKIKKSIQDFFDDQDGSITRSKVLMIGGMVIVFGMLLADEVYAAHRTHSTHRTHSSHRTSNNKHGSHNSHSSHSSSHGSHSDHYTHGSHSSHASHVSYTDSNNYGSTYTSSGRSWPDLADIHSIETPSVADISTPEIAQVLNTISNPDLNLSQLESVNTSIQSPPDTPQFKNGKD